MWFSGSNKRISQLFVDYMPHILCSSAKIGKWEEHTRYTPLAQI